MEKLAIVVRADAYDQVLTPLAFAYGAAASGVETDFLFVNWAVRLLTKDGEPAPVTHPGQDEWLRSQVEKAGLPPDVKDIIRALKKTGKVRFFACGLAAQIFDVKKEQLMDEVEGIVGSTWFLEENADKAHFQYL